MGLHVGDRDVGRRGERGGRGWRGLAAGRDEHEGGQQDGWRKEGTLHEDSSKSGNDCAPVWRRAAPGHRGEGKDQLTLTAVSSTTKLVWSEESSFIRNFTVTAWPL